MLVGVHTHTHTGCVAVGPRLPVEVDRVPPAEEDGSPFPPRSSSKCLFSILITSLRFFTSSFSL